MKPPFTYYGGKQKMLSHILPLIPMHSVYIEPFCGGAAVFWAKEPAAIEVLNDTNQQIINFYKVLATRPEDLAELIASTLHSRIWHQFADIVYNYPEFFDEVRRAWAVWAQCSMSFSSIIGNSWGYSKTPSGSGSDTTAIRVSTKREALSEGASLQAFKERLQHVQLECRDAVKLIESRDSPDAFFYVDPPYPNSSQGHYGGYKMGDMLRLLAALKSIKGRFLLSSYPYPELDAAVAENGWQTLQIEQNISAEKVDASKGQTRRKKIEQLTANYSLN